MIEITDYRAQLYDYLKNRMTAIAPNLTVLVGELVGARLIAHAGKFSYHLSPKNGQQKFYPKKYENMNNRKSYEN